MRTLTKSTILVAIIAMLIAACGSDGSDTTADPGSTDAETEATDGGTDGAAAGDPILLAGSLDLSGAAADVGKDVLNGIQYAVQELNEDGGVLGRQLEFEFQDNGTDPQQAADQSRSLAQQDPALLLAPQSSASAIRTSQLVSGELEQLMCVSSSNSDDLTIAEFQPYMYTMSANSYMEQVALAKTLGQTEHQRYAIIAPDYAGGRSAADRFKEFIVEENPDAEIVVEEYPPFGNTDYTASINKVLNADPDYVWTILFGADLVTFSKQAQAVGFFEQIDNNFVALYDNNTLRALGPDAAVGTDGWQRAPFNLIAENSAEGEEYVSGFQEEYGVVPSDWATLGYECITTWAQAAESAGATDFDPVIEALESETFDSLRGSIEFEAYDHQAIVPTYFGSVTQSEEFEQPILDITDIVEGSEAHPTEETVEELRGS